MQFNIEMIDCWENKLIDFSFQTFIFFNFLSIMYIVCVCVCDLPGFLLSLFFSVLSLPYTPNYATSEELVKNM